MAPHNKLLLRDAAGLAMAARVAAACSTSLADWLIVVTGHQAEGVAQAVRQAPVRAATRFVHASDHATGLSASLRAGMAALPSDAEAVLVCLGDMPDVGPEMMDRLIAAHFPGGPDDAVAPVWQGVRGNPVLWDRRRFPELAALSGDVGGRQLLRRRGMRVAEVPADGPGVLADCDTAHQAASAGYLGLATT